jgi:hypothetical protein
LAVTAAVTVALVPVNVIDLTGDTIPYWELRRKSSVATGIEDAFLRGLPHRRHLV